MKTNLRKNHIKIFGINNEFLISIDIDIKGLTGFNKPISTPTSHINNQPISKIPWTVGKLKKKD